MNFSSFFNASIIFMTKPRLLTDTSKLIALLARLLDQIILSTEEMSKGKSQYHSKTPPSISIAQYLNRISKFFHCSNSCYVLALAYIDLYQEKFQSFIVNKYCVHKLILVAMTVAAKFNDDFFFKNSYYSKVGGISTEELNDMEKTFLSDLEYKIYVKQQKFHEYLSKLAYYDEYLC